MLEVEYAALEYAGWSTLQRLLKQPVGSASRAKARTYF